MLARRYGYRGPFDPQLIDDIENPFREALLVGALQDGDPEEKRTMSVMKYLKNLFDVHGTMVIKTRGYKADKMKSIFADEAKTETVIRHTFTMPDGTIVKVVARG